MKRRLKILFIFVTVLFLFISGLNVDVSASNGVPYRTYTEDSSHRFIQTQDAYIPIALFDSLNDYELNSPEDLFIDRDNTLYIADTGNKRILVVEENLETVYSIGENELNQPKGVYVTVRDELISTDEGLVEITVKEIYVADYGNNAVYKYDLAGNLLNTFTRPVNNPLFHESASFQPSKVAVDDGGNIYVLDIGNENGVIQLNKHGEFLGYFGTNYTKPSLRTIIQFMFYTEEQKKKIYKLPPAPTNITIDNTGLVNTVTNFDSSIYIKRLNISGNNKLPADMKTDFNSLYNKDEAIKVEDIYIGPIGNIYVLTNVGFIAEYDMEGNLLFVFGGKDESGYVKGMLNTPAAIAVDKNFNIYTLDSKDNKIHVYMPTSFANHVHEALYYYQEGFYEESKEPWEEVLKVNSMFDLAHKGLANAYLKLERYEEALEHFEIANDKVGYSRSYWELRNEWLINNLNYVLILVILFIVDKLILQSFVSKRIMNVIKKAFIPLKKIKIFKELSFITYFFKNPADGYYGIKREGKVSILAAVIFYVIFYIEHMLSLYYTGFFFNYTETHTVSLLQEFSRFIVPILVFVIANYLVSSITDGEGKFKDVFKATIYSFVPLILFWPFVIIFSRVLTENEQFIYYQSMNILWAWSLVYLFIMIKEVHNYSIGETIKNILITLFTMFMLVASVFIFYILVNQVFSFVFDVIIEVMSNV